MKNLNEAMLSLKEDENKKHLTKTEARNLAREVLQHSVGIAYYKLEGYEDEYDEESIELVDHYLDIVATRALRAVGLDYITY